MELAELTKENRRVIILEHIPLGIDPYSSIKNNKTTLLLNKKYEKQYIDILNKYKQQIGIIYAGHLHSEYWQNINNIPVVGTLALNMLFGNNAGVKLIDYNNRTGELNNYNTYTVNFKNNQLVWSILYNYPASYNTLNDLAQFTQNFPFNPMESAVILYRKFYNGGATLYPQPIVSDKFWHHYYNFIHNIESPE